MKRNARKLVAILLACLMFAAIAACGNGTTTASPAADSGSASPADVSASDDSATAKRDTLNVAVSLDTGTLDPVLMTGKGGYLSVQRCYSEPLWDYTLDGKKFWVLATAFDQVGPLEFTMKVREGVKFSNGNPLTAEDILFTMKINKADSRAFLNVKAIDFDKTKVVDDSTLDVWYTNFDATQEPGIVQMQIVDAESYNPTDYAAHPVGTGPYVVTDYVVNSSVTCERRDDYWGDKPAIKTINFKCLSEESQRVNALETGDVDFAYITMKDVDYIKSLGTVNSDTLNTGSSLIAEYNMDTNGPLNSVEAREAVSYAIDCNAIIKVAYSGNSELINWGASQHLLEMQDSYLNMSDIYKDRHNVDKAKQLAEQSGLVGKTLRIVTNGAENYVTAAEVIQNGLEAIGVKATITNYDQATYFNFLMSKNEYDIAINTPVAPCNLPCDIFGNYPVFIPQDWSGPDHDKYIELGKQAISTSDQTKRMDLVGDLLEMFNAQCLWYGLCEDPGVTAYNKDLKNVQYTMSGLTLFQNYTF